MLLEFDAEKNLRNVRQHGIGFERFGEMDFTTAVIAEDTRVDYGEPRLRMFGLVDGRLHVAVVTPRGERIRVISLRRANQREERGYAQARQ